MTTCIFFQCGSCDCWPKESAISDTCIGSAIEVDDLDFLALVVREFSLFCISGDFLWGTIEGTGEEA